MYEYQTDFSKVCRVIANNTRLNMLWLLFETDLCVEDVAIQSQISPQHTSNLLSLMTSKFLLISERQNRRVIYRPHLGGPQKQLLVALKREKRHKTSHENIIAHATAFTHERRIQLARTLAAGPCTFNELQSRTGMKPPAQTRHLRKLVRRNVLSRDGDIYRLYKPASPLAKHLLSMAVK